MQKKWYLSTWLIVLMFAAWLFIIPPIIGIILAVLRFRQEKKNKLIFEEMQQNFQKMKEFNESIGFHRYEDVTTEVENIKTEITLLEQQKESIQQSFIQEVQEEKDKILLDIENLKKEIQSLSCEKEQKKQEILIETQEERKNILKSTELQKEKIEKEINELNLKLADLNNVIAINNQKCSELTVSISELDETIAKKTKQLANQENKLRRIKELYKSIDYCVQNFFQYVPQSEHILLTSDQFDEVENLAPTIISQLHCMNIKDLKKAYRENDKTIDNILNQYSKRYTTKANIAIYSLMVIALRAELQNVLTNLKYEKLDNAINEVKEICSKYLSIAGNGNQQIIGTLTKFIGEIEYLFINAVKIEYNYYVKKEQAKQEQLALREQMRQEAEERKALEAEKEKINREESKFNFEISKLNEQLQTASDKETELLRARIIELQSQLSDIVIKKEQISNLANGKAGNVYVISNLGSFGENVFKIGMTRRLDPQDRINELGSASVPFKFDVHSFIFSDDAVGLENKLHTILNDKRVNKVNLRKEFFYTTIDELEQLVNEIEPTAEFNKTMVAEEFRQSQSGEIYSNIENFNDIEDDFE